MQTAIEADESMEVDAWLSQAPSFLNATSFAARDVSRVPGTTGMLFYAEPCLREALEGPYDTPEPRHRAAMYIPPAATWILLAGESLYRLCRNDHLRCDDAYAGSDGRLWWNGRGFSLQRWAFWKQRFRETPADEGLESSVEDYARRAAEEMGVIEDQK